MSLAALGRCAEEAEEAGEAASASASALAGAMADAARCYWNLGLLDEARELYEDGLRVLVRLHGGNCEHGDGDGDGDGNIINVQGHGGQQQQQQPPDHPDVAAALHALASVHARQGDAMEAEKWYGAALAMKQRLHGRRVFHPEIGKTLNGMAMLRTGTAGGATDPALCESNMD